MDKYDFMNWCGESLSHSEDAKAQDILSKLEKECGRLINVGEGANGAKFFAFAGNVTYKVSDGKAEVVAPSDPEVQSANWKIKVKPTVTHHGIKGQKWGVRNGPPYPLGSGQKSAAERRASGGGGRKTASDSKPSKESGVISVLAAEAIAYGVATLTTILVAVGSKHVELAKKDALSKKGYHKAPESLEDYPQITDEHNTIQDMNAVNNKASVFSTGRNQNCVLCSTAYAMRRQGYDVVAAQTYRGYDLKQIEEMFGQEAVSLTDADPMDPETMFDKKAWDAFAEKELSRVDAGGEVDKEVLDGWCAKLKANNPPGSSGILQVRTLPFCGGHAIAWDIDKDGVAHIVDAQVGVHYTEGGKTTTKGIVDFDSWAESISDVRCDAITFNAETFNSQIASERNRIWTYNPDSTESQNGWTAKKAQRADTRQRRQELTDYRNRDDMNHDAFNEGAYFLEHHGIKGQKWGVRNGPPYPLGSDQKSSSELRGGSVSKKLTQNAGASTSSTAKYLKDKAKKKMDERKAAKEAAKNRVYTKEEIMNSEDPQFILDHRSELSTKELREALDRVNYTVKLQEMADEMPKGARAKIGKALSAAAKAAVTAAPTLLLIASAVANRVAPDSKFAKFTRDYRDVIFIVSAATAGKFVNSMVSAFRDDVIPPNPAPDAASGKNGKKVSAESGQVFKSMQFEKNEEDGGYSDQEAIDYIYDQLKKVEAKQ